MGDAEASARSDRRATIVRFGPHGRSDRRTTIVRFGPHGRSDRRTIVRFGPDPARSRPSRQRSLTRTALRSGRN